MLAKQETIAIKLLLINPLSAISIQKHLHRAELWYVCRGIGHAFLESKYITLSEGDSLTVPLGSVHGLFNYDIHKNLAVIEVQVGKKLSEEDIIRYKDWYGRNITKSHAKQQKTTPLHNPERTVI